MHLIGLKSPVGPMKRSGKSLPTIAAWWTVVLLLLASIGRPAGAQFGSSVSGTVLDSSRAAIPNASVVLTNAATAESRNTTTNATGACRFTELPSGQYSIVVTAARFKTSNLTNVAIEAESPRDVNVTLQPGGATESVEVRGDEIPLLQTDDASISTTLDSEQIQRLPTFGADPYELLRTAPGIVCDCQIMG